MNPNNKSILLFLFVLVVGMSDAIAQNETKNTSDEKILKSLIDSINMYPDNLGLHERYLKASGFTSWGAKDDPAFIGNYEKWMMKYPKSATLPYALGHAFAEKESPKAKPYLLKAIQIDPKMDKAYFDLWLDAERWGEFKKGQGYIGKASEIKPDDPNYAFYYASGFDDTDPAKWKELSLQVANRFPESERGAQALYWLAAKSQNNSDKIKYFELLKEKFPPSKFGWSSSGMAGYFDLLLKVAPDKAKILAKSMIGFASDDREKKMWNMNVATAEILVQAEALMSQQKYSEAINILDSMKLSRWSSAKDLVLIKKAHAYSASGNAEKAFMDLKVSYALSPDPAVANELNKIGKSLGKSQESIMNDVWYVRDTLAKLATPFTLNNYLTPGKTSLSDFKGKVVLLTYWFPGCGPCRGEFPHFQNVVDKFKGKDFAYVGINIVPEQNDYVIPFMKSSGYTFIPLEDFEGRDKGNLNNGGAAPVNFLIDKEGRIVFKNIRTDGSNEDVLAAMISETLSR